MKTKEFVKKLETFGFYLKHHSFQYTMGVIDISTRGSVNDSTLADISKDEVGVVKFNGPINKDVAEIIMKYANTPIEERNEENKYLVSIKGFSHRDSYLNLNSKTGEYSMESSAETSNFKTHFTKAEIDNLVADPNFFLQEGSYTLED